jgi:hypothetical protein
MQLVTRTVTPTGVEFVFAADHGARAYVRGRRSQSGVFRVELAEAVGGRGPDDDQAMAEEAATIAGSLAG